jgi:hypothetical protein
MLYILCIIAYQEVLYGCFYDARQPDHNRHGLPQLGHEDVPLGGNVLGQLWGITVLVLCVCMRVMCLLCVCMFVCLRVMCVLKNVVENVC